MGVGGEWGVWVGGGVGVEGSRGLVLTQDAELCVFGLLPHGVASDARIVASIGQIGLGDPQEGPIWGHLVRVFNSQGLAIFEPCDLGWWVAYTKMRQQDPSAGSDQVGSGVTGDSWPAQMWSLHPHLGCTAGIAWAFLRHSTALLGTGQRWPGRDRQDPFVYLSFLCLSIL